MGRCSTGRLAGRFVAFAVVLVLADAAVAAATPLGAWARWGAFRADGPPPRCWAVTRPVASSRGGQSVPALMVARFDGGGAPEVRVLLSRPAAGSRVRLSIDARAIGLVADGAEAHALHPQADASIVAAMRGAATLTVTGREASGRAFRDVYRLAGAASAIDAALLGCLP